ncbi:MULTISPECIES: hypothetical protein [Nonlabens]|uniref:hypothetical protein n=1 Tax=Nonlabens TaxID=363408 RepID=UPI000CF42595|nr:MULTISPECIES: hypothetical protein [Nonlabens]PQJ17014.1 hypothetical protein BST93_10095 [Nonlabens tegetincola]
MQKSNSIFLKSQLTKFLTEIRVENYSIENFDSTEYIVEFDPEEKQDPKTNSDDIMRLWSLPNIIGKQIKLNEVCDWLVTYKNEIPLWIKIRRTDQNNVLKLLISKRFRKMNIIEEWHQLNEYKPLINEKTPHNNV